MLKYAETHGVVQVGTFERHGDRCQSPTETARDHPADMTSEYPGN